MFQRAGSHDILATLYSYWHLSALGLFALSLFALKLQARELQIYKKIK